MAVWVVGSQVAADKGQRVSGQLMGAAQVTGIPYAFVVDREGVIRYNGHPADPQMDAVVKQVRFFDRAGLQAWPLFCTMRSHKELAFAQYQLPLPSASAERRRCCVTEAKTFRVWICSN